MLNITNTHVPEGMKIDEDTGTLRPKMKEALPIPRINNSEVLLQPEDWTLTQGTALGCLPLDDNGHIPIELVKYINGNFNVYDTGNVDTIVKQFTNSLIFQNHESTLAYGIVISAQPREVLVGKHTLTYIDVLCAVNKNIDKDFSKGIEDRTIKYTSFAHTAGDMVCAVCGNTELECYHIEEMIFRQEESGYIDVENNAPYGILHKAQNGFEVFENSYLTEKPAYGGAISHSVESFDKAIPVNVTRAEILHKAELACSEGEDVTDEVKSEALGITKKLLTELGI